MNLCRNMPKVKKGTAAASTSDETLLQQPSLIDDDMDELPIMIDDLDELDEDVCFCCLERKETAHVSWAYCNGV